jgi:AcrR family transcriptional regulator
MTARVSIDPDSIIDAALSIIEESGWEAVTARSIAQRLGASTMPIYSAIGSMVELRTKALDKAEALLLAEQRRKRTGEEALDLAVGYVAFARERPRLFHFVIAGRGIGPSGRPGEASASEAVKIGESRGVGDVPEVQGALSALSGEALRSDFLLRSWIFTHGLAELLAAGAFSMDDEEVRRHLLAAGGAFYMIDQNGGKVS